MRLLCSNIVKEALQGKNKNVLMGAVIDGKEKCAAVLAVVS